MEGFDLESFPVPEAINQRLLPINAASDVSVPNPAWTRMQYTTGLRGIRACSAHNMYAAVVGRNLHVHMAFCHDQTVSIAEAGTGLGQLAFPSRKKGPKWSSDTTAVAFDPSGVSAKVSRKRQAAFP